MLVGYLAMGRLAEGWLRLHPRLRWTECQEQALAKHQPDMIELVAWVGARLDDTQSEE